MDTNIRKAAQEAFMQIRSRYPNEQFCGYALYSDADAITVCPAVNTSRHLERMISADPTDAEYYRWSPAEWAFESEGADGFSEISDRLRHVAMSIDDDEERKKFKNQVYQSCIDALVALREEGFFSDLDELGVLVFAISDGEHERELEWIDRLNHQDVSEKFREWLSSF